MINLVPAAAARVAGRAGWPAGCGPLLPLIAAATAPAQWTAVSLHPPGATRSESYAIHDGQQVGQAVIGGWSHAVLWTGSAQSYVDLHPSGAQNSGALGVGDGQQVGSVTYPGFAGRAVLWSGSAGSWTELHPPSSIVNATHDGKHAGSVFVGGSTHAVMWNGTAPPLVDLHPAGASSSDAFGIDADQQVGHVGVNGSSHAALWTGTAASWIDLHPPGAGFESTAFGVHAGQQVGVFQGRAALWIGTAASLVDLTPAGATGSQAFGVYDGYQVGFAWFGGSMRAILWRGSAASWEDLSPALPGSWGATSARGVWHDGTTLYVVGTGFNTATGRDEALLWKRPIGIPCYPDCNADGALTVADFGCYQTRFVAQDIYADCNKDQKLTVADFGCFQTRFVAGCP